ncbi:hypothetical protein SAMN04488074_101946 [Lentzea albidocapillata subsp. violacea]|uniref:Uncharacterized protein n=1 Tax=Lentzea albidocapillata subsp. violacea TaxID=128104 RepID=A0A1G8SDD6_9PSEU|nr:hypothetical protein [Lentzea albidocapillata]SDJ27163.1 hypothetical protein SAMN04488074_101946 [Lentzea albidocapillata subsp. violacea]
MARSRGKKGHTGASMGGAIVRIPRADPLQRNDKSCPVCYSVARQPCRQVVSKPGATVLKLGRPIPTMHRARSGKPASDTPQQPEPRRTPAHRRSQEPVPIERLHPDRAGFVPKNLRDGGPLAKAWNRNNSDALPRATDP